MGWAGLGGGGTNIFVIYLGGGRVFFSNGMGVGGGGGRQKFCYHMKMYPPPTPTPSNKWLFPYLGLNLNQG